MEVALAYDLETNIGIMQWPKRNYFDISVRKGFFTKLKTDSERMSIASNIIIG